MRILKLFSGFKNLVCWHKRQIPQHSISQYQGLYHHGRRQTYEKDQTRIDMTRVNSTNGRAQDHRRRSVFDATIITISTKPRHGLRMSYLWHEAHMQELGNIDIMFAQKYGDNTAKPSHRCNILFNIFILIY